MFFMDYFGLSISVILLGLSPGPGAFAVISRSLSDGFNKSIFIIYGIMFSHVLYVLITVYGLGYIANEFEYIFIYIKYLGALYLMYLSYKLWNKNMQLKDNNNNQVSNKMNFISGCMIAFSNPKAIIFYIGFLPAFINLNNLKIIEIVNISILIPIALSSVLILYAFIANKARKIMQNDSSVLLLNRISSLMMFVVAIVILIKQ